MTSKKSGIIEKLSWRSIVAAIITVFSFYFGIPAYLFDARPSFVANLGSEVVCFIEGAMLGAITVLVVLKLYTRISSDTKEERIEGRQDYISRTFQFEDTLPPKKERILFEVKGSGFFQRLEIQVNGNPDSRMILIVDNNIAWNESFEELLQKSSQYLRSYTRPSPEAGAICAVELDLTKNFFADLKLLIKNLDMKSGLKTKGTVHYNLFETR